MDSRRSQHQSIAIATVELLEPGVEIAPQGNKAKIAAQAAQLGLAPHAAGPYARAGGKVNKPLAVVGNQSVARVFTLGHGGYDEAGGLVGGQVLHAVHGRIHRAVGQCLLDFLDEESLGS